MKIYFCLGAIEFQCNFVLRPSKVRKLVRTNQFQVKSTKIDTVRKFVTLQYLGCVYTYPDIRISGYPDVRDPDIFGAFTRVGSKRFRRLHVSRHPDALYAAYSLSVGEIRKCFFFGQVACLQTLFHFFLSFC